VRRHVVGGGCCGGLLLLFLLSSVVVCGMVCVCGASWVRWEGGAIDRQQGVRVAWRVVWMSGLEGMNGEAGLWASWRVF
jgi:hypothetical protein